MEPTEAIRERLTDLFRTALLKKDLNVFLEGYQSKQNLLNENDMKTLTENVVRDNLLEVMRTTDYEVLELLFQFSIDLANQDICASGVPVLFFGDMLDGSTLAESEKIFSFIESRVDVFTTDMFFKSCKNHLLRSCNDLLRRLSRSQDTVFCGRILLFLARIFPLSERSGLNIISEFNYENTTIYSSKDDLGEEMEKDTVMEEGEITARPISTDYTLYKKFWSLQEFFRNPNSCYNKIHWKHFTNYTSDILTVFGSFKSDDATSSKWKHVEVASDGSLNYFAKYLTSQKLLELELSDSNFRRYLLIQFLILFQYLSSPVKFKLETYVLTEEQQTWVKETNERVYKLLEETPPNGVSFSQNIAKILKREEQWNAWKNEGCPDFKSIDETTKLKITKPKKRLGDELAHSKKVLIGNAELTKLWNICPDNWEACKAPRRRFTPSMNKFFKNAIEQADPANGIEDRYKDVNDPKFGWRALRLLSRNSPIFFTASFEQTKSVPQYIESVIQTIPKKGNRQQIQQENPLENVATVTDEVIEEGEEMLPSNEEDTKVEVEKLRKVDILTAAHVDALCKLPSYLNKWTTIATYLDFKEDEIAHFDTTCSNAKEKLKKMLTVWQEQDPLGGSLACFEAALTGAGFDVSREFFNSL